LLAGGPGQLFEREPHGRVLGKAIGRAETGRPLGSAIGGEVIRRRDMPGQIATSFGVQTSPVEMPDGRFQISSSCAAIDNGVLAAEGSGSLQSQMRTGENLYLTEKGMVRRRR